MKDGSCHTDLLAASCLLGLDESLSLSLQGVDGRSVTDDHGRTSSRRWRSHGGSGEDGNNGGDGELHFEGGGCCVGTKEDRRVNVEDVGWK